MADSPAVIDIEGLLEAQRKGEQVVSDLRGEPFLNAMRTAVLLVQRDAKRLAPVDTGLLRASIMPEVRAQDRTVQGVVGSNVTYAAAVELGSRPHMPPLAALEAWAARHGTTARAVARGIAMHGTRPRAFLSGALEENQDRVVELLGDGVTGIINT